MGVSQRLWRRLRLSGTASARQWHTAIGLPARKKRARRRNELQRRALVATWQAGAADTLNANRSLAQVVAQYQEENGRISRSLDRSGSHGLRGNEEAREALTPCPSPKGRGELLSIRRRFQFFDGPVEFFDGAVEFFDDRREGGLL